MWDANLICLVYDPLEAELPDAGRLMMSDGEGQVQVNTRSKKLRGEFKSHFSQRLEQMQQLSGQRGIPLLPLQTTLPVLEQVRDLLGRR